MSTIIMVVRLVIASLTFNTDEVPEPATGGDMCAEIVNPEIICDDDYPCWAIAEATSHGNCWKEGDR